MKSKAARIGLFLLGVGALTGVGWLGLFSPMSPSANDWAAVSMLQGESARALEQYRAIADYNPLVSQQRIAIERGARILDRGDGDRLEAARWYERLADLADDDEARASALERAGSAYAAVGSAAAAAAAFHSAWQAAPGSEAGSLRLLDAARSFASAGNMARAQELLALIGDTAIVRDSADLTRGDLMLEVGDLQGALMRYEDAARLATTEGIREAAREGATTCLERLAHSDEALAEVD